MAKSRNGAISRLSKEELENLLMQSNSYEEVLKTLKLRAAGGNYKALHAHVEKLGVDTSVFKERRINMQTSAMKKYVTPATEEILVENSYYSRSSAKRCLLREKLMDYKCSSCGIGPEWNMKPLTLQLDHINGVFNDHRIDNLRFLCPNCHSQTDTYAGKNA